MKPNPVILGVIAVAAIAALLFAYRFGQQSAGTSGGGLAELERLRADYEKTSETYAADLKEIRKELADKTKELEQLVYGLREQLARAGVEIPPIGGRATPGARGGAEAPSGPIAKESFYQLRTGMSLQDVERLLGRAGELSYRMAENDGTSTENYRWKWLEPNGEEGQITVTLRNNKLEDKEFWGDKEEE